MKKTKTKIIVIIILLLAIIGSGLYLFKSNDTKEAVEDLPPIIEPVEVFDDDEKNLLETWKKHKQINDDYRCELVFDSGIINLPVVQGETNTKYERTDWETMSHDEEGSIFMDYECTINSSNITLYGHYVYPSLDPEQTHKFSPLTLLLDQANYEDNCKLKLVLEDEIRYYQVAYVFYCPLNYSVEGYYYVDDNAQYYLPEYSIDYFDIYKDYVEQNKLYDSGISIEFGDKTLTLQTCVRNHDELREIVVCKEISSKSE